MGSHHLDAATGSVLPTDRNNKLLCHACRNSHHKGCTLRRRLGHGQWAPCFCKKCKHKQKGKK